MAGREPAEVTVEIDGQEFIAGTLWVHEQRAAAANSTPRSPRNADFLLGVRDNIRKEPSGSGIPAPATTIHARNAVPRVIELPRLLHAVDHLGDDAPALPAPSPCWRRLMVSNAATWRSLR
jgi:hypothetical protein